MAIKGKSATPAKAATPGPIKPAATAGAGLALEFVDEIPAPVRPNSSGRQISEETQAIIDALTANPGKPAYLGVRKTAQASRTLRAHGILEEFRRREDDEFDRYATFVGIENMPEPRKRSRKTDEDSEEEAAA